MRSVAGLVRILITPPSLAEESDRESATSKLVSFLSRHTYAPLELSATPAKKKRRRVLLLTGLPNLSHLPTRQAFHAALLDFSRTYSPSGSPLIIVHSDSGSGGRAEESWMDRERGGREGAVEVVGKDVLNSPYCLQVEWVFCQNQRSWTDRQLHSACSYLHHKSSQASS